LTNCGAMRRAVWPIDSSLHAQWWALEHASMPTRLREEERGDLIGPQQVLDQIEADCRTLHGGRFFRCAAPVRTPEGSAPRSAPLEVRMAQHSCPAAI
jgi:hypothetical protein